MGKTAAAKTDSNKKLYDMIKQLGKDAYYARDPKVAERKRSEAFELLRQALNKKY